MIDMTMEQWQQHEKPVDAIWTWCTGKIFQKVKKILELSIACLSRSLRQEFLIDSSDLFNDILQVSFFGKIDENIFYRL